MFMFFYFGWRLSFDRKELEESGRNTLILIMPEKNPKQLDPRRDDGHELETQIILRIPEVCAICLYICLSDKVMFSRSQPKFCEKPSKRVQTL